MKIRYFSIFAVLIFAVFLLVEELSISAPKLNLRPIRIAVPKLYSSALMILAHEKKIFKKNGLDVSLGSFDYGKDCLEEMLKNNFDFSIAYITPIAKKIHTGHEFLILSELHNSSENTLILYRKDLLKDLVKDFQSTRIGLVKGTNSEFLLSLFAGANLIDYKSLKLVGADLNRLELDLLSGKLGAAIFWQPKAHKLLSKHPEILEKISTPFYTDMSLLVGNNEFIDKHDKETSLLVKSLVEAKSFFDSSPTEANKIILKYINESSETYTQGAFKDIKIELRLSQIMIVMLESEIRWLSQSKFKFIKKLNKEDILRKKYLEKLLPSSVTFQ